jgi:uncharacterized Zn finger protein (UPF0148 family)
MTGNCPYCGTELKKTTFGRYFCPNCGIIDSEEPSKDDKGSYIG